MRLSYSQQTLISGCRKGSMRMSYLHRTLLVSVECAGYFCLVSPKRGGPRLKKRSPSSPSKLRQENRTGWGSVTCANEPIEIKGVTEQVSAGFIGSDMCVLQHVAMAGGEAFIPMPLMELSPCNHPLFRRKHRRTQEFISA